MIFELHQYYRYIDTFGFWQDKNICDDPTHAECGHSNLKLRDAQPADRSDDDLENEPQYLKGGYPFDEHITFTFVVYFRCSNFRKLGQGTSLAETTYLKGEEVERSFVF